MSLFHASGITYPIGWGMRYCTLPIPAVTDGDLLVRSADLRMSALAGSVMAVLGAQTLTLKVATQTVHTEVRSDESCLSTVLTTKLAFLSVPHIPPCLKPPFNPSYHWSPY